MGRANPWRGRKAPPNPPSPKSPLCLTGAGACPVGLAARSGALLDPPRSAGGPCGLAPSVRVRGVRPRPAVATGRRAEGDPAAYTCCGVWGPCVGSPGYACLDRCRGGEVDPQRPLRWPPWLGLERRGCEPPRCAGWRTTARPASTSSFGRRGQFLESFASLCLAWPSLA